MQGRKAIVLASLAVLLTACGAVPAPPSNGRDAGSDSDADGDATIVPPPRDAGGCGNHPTTLSGKVLDPGGKNPVYQVMIYVPSAPVTPLVHGATCDRCDEPLSSKPIVSTLTDVEGRFVLENTPSGDAVPIVIQLGKWRRQLTLPNVAPCADTALDPGATRLPKSQSEGDMPKIALVPGVDRLEELIADLGVDATEFTSPSGKGAIHVYPDATSAADLFGSSSAMMTYDAIVNGCDESTSSFADAWHQNIATYLDVGGRLYATHDQLRWFSEPGAPVALRSAATWTTWGAGVPPPYLVDVTTPKTKALADWLKRVFPSSTYAEMPLPPVPWTVPSDIGAPNPNASIRIVYPKGTSHSTYLSITTPTTLPPAQRCGRAILSDAHAAWAGKQPLAARTTFPGAFEFMFFALQACAQDDAMPPIIPPLN